MKNITKKITKVLLSISLLGLLLGLINKLIYIISSLNTKLYNPRSYYYEWKFGKIYYTVSGNGKPILLIHSMKNGASSYEFKKIISQLSKRNTVYTIDLIGYGKSEKPKITYTSYLYVQLVSDFINNVINSSCDIITSGKSNSFVTMMTIQDPNLINKLVYINPSDLNLLSQNPRNKDKIFKYILETPIIGTTIFNIISSKFYIKKQFNNTYFYNKISTGGKFINAFYEVSHIGESSNKYALASNICKYNNSNINTAISQINNSIYIIQGSHRNYDTDKIIGDYKKLNPSIEGSIINKTKEFPHIEKPNLILEVLSIYLH